MTANEVVTPDAGPFHLAHINVLAHDLDRSLRFYQDVLGATYVGNIGPAKVITEVGGFELFIEHAQDFVVDPRFHFGFRTSRSGVYSFARRLERLGVPMVKGNNTVPGPVSIAGDARVALYFEDPDGWLIEVYSPETRVLEAGILTRDARWPAAPDTTMTVRDA